MKKYTGIITIAFMVLALAVPAGAQMYGRGMGRDTKPGLEKKGAALTRIQEIRANLTTEQRDAIRKTRNAFLDETVELRNKIREKGAKFRDLLKSDKPDKNEVMAARQKLMDLKTILFQKKFDLMQQQREIINSKNNEG